MRIAPWALVLVTGVAGVLCSGCAGNTVAPSNVTDQSATLRGEAECEGSPPCFYYFRYREAGTSAWRHVPEPSAARGPFGNTNGRAPVQENATGLRPATDYEYQLCGKGDQYPEYVCVGPDSETFAQQFRTSPPVLTADRSRAEPVLTFPDQACPNSRPPPRDNVDFDIVDMAPRAWIDAGGKVNLLAVHFDAFGARARTVIHDATGAFTFDRDCTTPMLRSLASSNYHRHRSFEWLESTYTKDGSRVLGIVDNDWNGRDWFPAQCDDNGECWWGSLTMFRSTTGGRTFGEIADPANDPLNHVLARPPEPADPMTSPINPLRPTPTGYFGITNILKNPINGHYYMLANTGNVDGPQSGVCVIRAAPNANLEQHESWFGYSGDAADGTPTFTANLNGKAGCRRAPSPIAGIRYIAWSVPLRKFVAVRMATDGVYFMTTSDPNLLRWDPQPARPAFPAVSAFQFTAEVRQRVASYGGDPDHGFYYPTLVDHSYLTIARSGGFTQDPTLPYAAPEERRNFDLIGRNPHLYIVRWDQSPSAHHARSVYRYPLTISGG